jgi:HSP20 family protein
MARKNQKTLKGQPRKDSTALDRRREDTFAPIGVSPFSFVKRFGDEMDRLLGDFGLGGWVPPAFKGESNGATWAPQVEMFERNGELVVRADLPGLKKEDVKVEFTDDGLTIAGERRSEHEEKGEGYYRSERSYGHFYRRLPLPEGANPDNSTAKFHDGVLEVTMPARKPIARAPRKLEIQEGSQPKSKAKAA